MGVRLALVRLALGAVTTALLALCVSGPAPAFDSGPSCAIQDARGDGGVVIRVFFAKNGAVQRYQVVGGWGNIEGVHDALNELQSRFGPEGENAPPVNIVSFKRTSNGLQIPDKAVDSCGRTISFH